jgi:hypothetical protein
MVDYKGGECQLCGYNRCLRALDFHHVDPATKRFHLAGSHNRSWESLRAELDKCLLVCSNCHDEIEAGKAQIPRRLLAKVELAVSVARRKPRRCGRPAKDAWLADVDARAR